MTNLLNKLRDSQWGGGGLHPNTEALTKILRYIRWVFLQRMFWHNEARNRLWLSHWIKENTNLHDKP